jgi:hypothetical protein
LNWAVLVAKEREPAYPNRSACGRAVIDKGGGALEQTGTNRIAAVKW